MADESSTLARPYAEAIFELAGETGKLTEWSEMLAFLAAVIENPAMDGVIGNPRLDRERMTELLLDIGEERLDEEGRNLVRLLVRNGRVALLPRIAEQFEQRKADAEGVIDVHVTSAYAMKPAQQKMLAGMLEKRLGKKVEIRSEKDPSLLGGVVIRAADTVIDGSLRGQLQRLATELEI